MLNTFKYLLAVSMSLKKFLFKSFVHLKKKNIRLLVFLAIEYKEFFVSFTCR